MKMLSITISCEGCLLLVFGVSFKCGQVEMQQSRDVDATRPLCEMEFFSG